MNAFGRYNITVLGSMALAASVLFSVAIYMRPLDGDLTRVGGYLENDFGWNVPQDSFEQPQFMLAKSIGDYDKHYDVVVIGDSYSRRTYTGWQNYFVDLTGLSLITLDIQNVSIWDIIKSPTFLASPPFLVICSSVEWGLWLRNSQCAKAEGTGKNDGMKNILSTPVSPLHRKTVKNYPKHESFLERKISLDAAASYILKSSARNIFGINVSKAEKFALNRKELFSNKGNVFLLVSEEDLWMRDFSEDKIDIIKCNLLKMQNKVQSNNHTRFMVMVVPDKLTAYSNYLVDKKYASSGITDRLAEDQELMIPRVDMAIKQAIDRGVEDVYLPNDIHWGSEGYRIGAEAVCGFLVMRGILQPFDASSGFNQH